MKTRRALLFRTVSISLLVTAVATALLMPFAGEVNAGPRFQDDDNGVRFEFLPIPSPQTVGRAFEITIRALDGDGDLDDDYDADADLTVSAGTIEPGATGAFEDGEWTGDVTITDTTGEVWITAVHGGRQGTSEPFDLEPADVVVRVTIVTAPDGEGDEAGSYTMTADDAWALYAAGYDAENNYVGDVPVTWSVSGGIGTVGPGPAGSTTLDATTVGTGRVSATHETVAGDETGDVTVEPGDLAFFEFDPIPSSQTIGTPFGVTITGEDGDGNVTTDYTGSADLQDTTGTVEPRTTGAFVAGVWMGDVTIGEAGDHVTITAEDGTAAGYSNEFDVVTEADLRLAVTHTPSLFSPGGLMTFTVTYGNAGGTDAHGVVISTTPPAGVAPTAETLAAWHSDDGVSYAFEIEEDGELPAGETGRTVLFVVRHQDPLQLGAPSFPTRFSITARDAGSGEADPADNVLDHSVGVPDLTIRDLEVAPWPLEAEVPVVFTITIENRGTNWAWNPVNGGGFWVDVYVSPVASFPYERDSAKGIALDCQPLPPGTGVQLVISEVYPWSETHRGPIVFSQEEVDAIPAFYAKADNFYSSPYGLVPEHDELNNVWPALSTRLYLPVVARAQ